MCMSTGWCSTQCHSQHKTQDNNQTFTSMYFIPKHICLNIENIYFTVHSPFTWMGQFAWWFYLCSWNSLPLSWLHPTFEVYGSCFFELRLISVGLKVQKLWAFKNERFVWKTLLWLWAKPSDSGCTLFPLVRYIFAKSLIGNQIRLLQLFRIYPNFRLLDSTALIQTRDPAQTR